MFRNGFVFRLIGVVLLVGLVAAGGFMAFRAGEARGISQAPAVATAISQATENGQGVSLPPMMYGHGYAYGYGPGYPMMYGRPFGFFPGGICLSILFLFLFLGAMRMIFFRRMVHGGHMHGPWGRHGGDGVPPMFNEWHKRAHAEKPGEEQSSGAKA